MSRSRTLAALGAVLLALGTLTAGLATSSQASVSSAGPTTTIGADYGTYLTMPDGVALAAEVVTASGPGPHPLIVMPTSWTAREIQYHNVAVLFALNGFDVIAYTQRGFTDSQGTAANPGVTDFADPRTVADASSVIDWGLANLNITAGEIAMMGQSYGASVSLLAAEQDPRIKAVVALSTWTDWDSTFLPSGSLATEALGTLLTSAQVPGIATFGPQLSQLASQYLASPTKAIALIKSMAAGRSPIADVKALNANHTAVLLSNGFQDSIFAPSQVANFYTKLTGPKRLDLGTGDHGQVEAAAIEYGTDTGPVADALQWFQHYLLGASNSVYASPHIRLQDSVTGTTSGYKYWPAATKDTVNALALPGSSNGVNLSVGSDSTWSASTTILGYDTVARTPPEDFDVSAPYHFATVDTAQFSDAHSWVWDGAPLSVTRTVTGAIFIHLTIASSAKDTSLFAYLYDVGPSGTGTLMSVAPYSATGLTENVAKAVTIALQPVCWQVDAGDHLALVIGTADPRWHSLSPSGSMLTISSTATDPALIEVPSS